MTAYPGPEEPSRVDTSFLARKERAIAEDLKTAFSGYDRLVRQVGEIRTWTVTIEVAALGLLLSGKVVVRPIAALIPATLALLAFMILELRARSSMRFNKEEVLAIEHLFMMENEIKYAHAITEFEFRDLRLSKLTRATKLTHLFAAMFDLNIALWYGFWLAVVIFEYVYFS